MFCKNCGKEIQGNDVFCGNCGAKVNVTSTKSKEIKNEKVKLDKKKAIKISLTRLILVIIGTLLIFCISTGIIISINKKKTPISKEDYINDNNKIISIQNDTGCVKLDNNLWLIGAKDVKINSNNHIVELTTIEYPAYHYNFEYKYDEKNRISNVVKNIEYDNTKYEYKYNIDYTDTSSQKINKIIRTVNLDEQEALNRMECPYAEIKYEYNANGDIVKITEFQYMNTPDNTDKYLFKEINYNFDYNIYVSNVVNMTSTTRMIQFSSNNGNGVSYNIAYNTASTYKYETIQKYDVSGNKEDIRVGKNAYEEILIDLFQENNYLLRRSQAEVINYGNSYATTTPYRESKYIMYPSNVTIYDNDKKISETTYSYNDKNYLYSSGNVMDNSTYKGYFYKYNDNKMGVFTGTGTDNNLIYEITFEDDTIKKIEYVEKNERNKLARKYTSDLDVPWSKEDAYIDTFYNNSYYMYVYLTDEKVKQGNFMEDLKLIGGIYNMGQEKGKWTLYVKKDVYDRVYNKIQSIDGVKSIERTKTIVEQEDVNKIDVDSTDKYLMQIWGKDTKFMRREFYNFCQQYRRNNLFV